MPNQLATPFPGPQPWEAPDPLPVMRRELKLLLIEMNVLRVEVQQLRAMEREARKTEEFLSASVKRVMASRDHWRREARTPPRVNRTSTAMVAILVALR